MVYREMNCIVSHVLREGNQVADEPANHVVTLPSLNIWSEVPLFIRDSFLRNKSGLSAFRICNYGLEFWPNPLLFVVPIFFFLCIFWG